MTNMLFWGAGGFAALWCLVHLFLGGRQIARPLLRAGSLAPTVRHTQYLCWHFTSVAIAFMAGLFIAAALTGVTALATAGTTLAIGFFLTGVGLVWHLSESHTRLPQGWLFLPVAALGIAGLLS